MNYILRISRLNAGVLKIAMLVFLSNQFLEFLILYTNAETYARLCDWDCPWYAGIVENGYDFQAHAHERGDAANWAFFPALPLVASIFSKLGVFSAAGALIVVSKLFFFLAIFAFIKFCALYAPKVSPWVAGVVVGLHPYAIYGNVGYTEPMFLFFTCASFIALKQRNFVTAGLTGAVLSAVRPTGVFFVIAYLITALRQLPQAPAFVRMRMGLGLLLVPLGLALFMLFLYYRMGDALAFSHVQIAWDRVPTNPFEHINNGMNAIDLTHQLWAWMSVLALLMILYLVLVKEYGLAMFALCATLIPLSTGLAAMPRYLWWQAPLLLVVAQCVSVSYVSLTRLRGSEAASAARAPSKWQLVPLAVLVIPAGVWGLWAMYYAWLIRESYVI